MTTWTKPVSSSPDPNPPRGSKTKWSLGYLLMMAVSLCAMQAHFSYAQQIKDGIAAIVNAEIITISELENELRDETVRLKARYEGEELEERLVQKEYDVLNRLIERKLQLQEAKEKGIGVTEEELESVLEQLRENQPTVANSTPRDQLREELILRRMMDFEIRRRIVVSPEEVRTYYINGQEEFTAPSEYHLRQILIKPNAEESHSEAMARAKQIFDQLQEGGNFSELAQRYSDGSESVLGGDLGFVRKNELLAPLANTLDGMQEGDISPLIQTELGIHILTLEKTKPGKPLPFEEVEETIKSNLMQRKTRKAHQEWLSSLKDKAYIEIKF